MLNLPGGRPPRPNKLRDSTSMLMELALLHIISLANSMPLKPVTLLETLSQPKITPTPYPNTLELPTLTNIAHVKRPRLRQALPFQRRLE